MPLQAGTSFAFGAVPLGHRLADAIAVLFQVDERPIAVPAHRLQVYHAAQFKPVLEMQEPIAAVRRCDPRAWWGPLMELAPWCMTIFSSYGPYTLRARSTVCQPYSTPPAG